LAHEILILTLTAASIGFFHTLLGPDHYLPFIMMSKARQWSQAKTRRITFICGVGHVASSVVLGFVGIALGIALSRLEGIESSRGSIAAWSLIIFGLVYFVWGMHRARKGQEHAHRHLFDKGSHHHHNEPGKHEKTEENGSTSIEGENEPLVMEEKKNVTPWVLFTIFVFGPCEPLIPILMYPAAESNILGVVVVTLVFGMVTIATMLAVVHFSSERMNRLPLRRLERYTHAIAGATIFLAGMAIEFLGL